MVCPNPVAKRVITEPIAAGLVVELTLPSSFRTTAWPLPNPEMVNKAGVAATTGTDIAEDCPAPFCTTMIVDGAATSKGTTTLI